MFSFKRKVRADAIFSQYNEYDRLDDIVQICSFRKIFDYSESEEFDVNSLVEEVIIKVKNRILSSNASELLQFSDKAGIYWDNQIENRELVLRDKILISKGNIFLGIHDHKGLPHMHYFAEWRGVFMKDGKPIRCCPNCKEML